jgi:hypothetical protein
MLHSRQNQEVRARPREYRTLLGQWVRLRRQALGEIKEADSPEIGELWSAISRLAYLGAWTSTILARGDRVDLSDGGEDLPAVGGVSPWLVGGLVAFGALGGICLGMSLGILLALAVTVAP